MRKIRVLAIAVVFCCVFAGQAFGQTKDRAKYAPYCPSLVDAKPPDLLAFLDKNSPDMTNFRTPVNYCVTYAIYAVAAEHFEPAIPAVIRLLDFRRPPFPSEVTWTHLPGPDEMFAAFPAASALRTFGKAALPDILKAIEAESNSKNTWEAAAWVWLEVYRDQGSMAQGFAALRQEAMKTTDPGVEQRLNDVIGESLQWWCVPKQDAGAEACRQAAETGVAPDATQRNQ